jgi:exosortase A
MSDVLGLPKYWLRPLAGFSLATLALLLIFRETWQSIIDIWIRSETYTHGFLVAPISLWLIWHNRSNYRHLHPSFSRLGLLAVLGFGFSWMCAHLVQVLVVQQWAVVGLLVCSIWTILGSQVTYSMLFPILFLFMMVPFGEDFVPTLMEFTASFVVGMLRLTGVSVYREGLHFSLTTGNWSVVDACSGIRYLIASVTLGLVYMYLNYTKTRKRLLFMLVAILLPILANGLRGYMIVMIGHLSDMKLATGVDHLIYGWLFFGLVMLLLFYIGSFWQDPPDVPLIDKGLQVENEQSSYPYFWGILTILSVCLFIWPLTSIWLTDRQGEHVEIPGQFSRAPDPQWQLINEPDWEWQPLFPNVITNELHYFANGGRVVALYAGNYGNEELGKLVSSQNILVPQKDKVWRILVTGKAAIPIADGKQLDFEKNIVASERIELLVYRWYRIGAYSTSNNYIAKAMQLWKRLSGDTSPELQMVLYTPTTVIDRTAAESLLQTIAAQCCG